MKVLWVEDHQPVRELLAIAADKAARNRVQIDLVLAASLLEAETRLRLERFDLVVLDLTLPDSIDADMTIARMANMGTFRIAAVSATEGRDKAVETARACGCNISPHSISKATVPFNRFIQRPASFEQFLLEMMPASTAETVRAA